MRNFDRREFLAALSGAGSAAFAGCSVCATSYRVYDDLLRVSIRDFQVLDNSFHGEARILHRGPDNWDWGSSDRDTFYTEYEGVRFLGYSYDGTNVVEIPLGEFEPGTTKRKSFQTATFPMVITAVPESVSHDTNCPHADAGAHIGVYAGQYKTESPPDWETGDAMDPRKVVEDQLQRRGAGHRWIPYSELADHENEQPSTDEFDHAKCVQRILKGRDVHGPPDLSVFPPADRWITRHERTSFTLYGVEAQAERPDTRTRAAEIPEQIAELVQTTDWGEMDGIKTTSKSVSFAEWKRLVGELEGADGPTYPSCDSEGVLCSDSWEWGSRGQCRPGRITAYYQFNPDRVIEETGDRRTLYWTNSSVVRMDYSWEGVQESTYQSVTDRYGALDALHRPLTPNRD